MSELPPQQPRPESPRIIIPDEFTDEEKRRFGGTSYHSYEDYDERAGAQAEREYAAGDKGPEPNTTSPDDTPSPEDEPPTTKMDAGDSEPAPSSPEEDLDETTKMPKIEKDDDEKNDKEKYDRAIEKIDAADRLKGYKRVLALGELALDLSGENYGYEGIDLGVIAATRIRRSATRGPIGRLLNRRAKYSDYYLHKMATEGEGNLSAATSMSRGGYLRDKTIFRGRNDALYQVAKKVEIDPRKVKGLKPGKKAEDVLELTKGLRKRKYRYEGYMHLAEERGDPALQEAVAGLTGLYNLYKKEQIRAKGAIGLAKKGERDKAKAVAQELRWPSVRNQTLYEISKI
jgi:hypothetical protein